MPVRVSLTAVEDDLLGNLHEIPDGPVRDELVAVMRELSRRCDESVVAAPTSGSRSGTDAGCQASSSCTTR